jgi:hypothetical protein
MEGLSSPPLINPHHWQALPPTRPLTLFYSCNRTGTMQTHIFLINLINLINLTLATILTAP